MSSVCVIDIETEPLPDMHVPEGLGEPDFSNPPDTLEKSRFKTDRAAHERAVKEKKEKWHSEQVAKAQAAMEKYREDATLCPMLSRVAAIGWRGFSAGGSSTGIVLDATEGEMLAEMSDVIRGHDIVVGHNVTFFDLPYLYWRCVANGKIGLMAGLYSFYNGKLSWYKDKYIDTCSIAHQMPGRNLPSKFHSLDQICRMLGIEGKSASGDMFWRMSPEEKLLYLTDDIDKTHQVAALMGLAPMFIQEPKENENTKNTAQH